MLIQLVSNTIYFKKILNKNKAFGIRNVPRIDKALNEAFRVLKKGGRIMILEFSKV